MAEALKVNMIPKIIHQIWISRKNSTMPPFCQDFSDEWKKLHPHWEYHLWDNESIKKYFFDKILLELWINPTYDEAAVTNRLRFLILKEYGGVYCDIDAKPIKPLDELILPQYSAIIGKMDPSEEHKIPTDVSVLIFESEHIVVKELLETGNWKRVRAGWMAKFIFSKADKTFNILDSNAFFGHILTPDTYVLHWPYRLHSWGKNEISEPVILSTPQRVVVHASHLQKRTIGIGDLVAIGAQPIAKVIDKVAGGKTNLQNCGGCNQRKDNLNKMVPDIMHPFTSSKK